MFAPGLIIRNLTSLLRKNAIFLKSGRQQVALLHGRLVAVAVACGHGGGGVIEAHCGTAVALGQLCSACRGNSNCAWLAQQASC